MKTTNQMTFTDFFSKRTFVLPKGEEKKYRFYKNRYVIAIMLAVFMYSFKVNVYLVGAISIGYAIVSELSYRFKFLKSLTILPEHSVKTKEIASKSLIMNAVLYFFLGALLIYMALTQVTEQMTMILILGFGIVACGVSITYILKYFGDRDGL